MPVARQRDLRPASLTTRRVCSAPSRGSQTRPRTGKIFRRPGYPCADRQPRAAMAFPASAGRRAYPTIETAINTPAAPNAQRKSPKAKAWD